MKLSVIIINYNSKDLLKQCLLSVQKAISGIEGEVIVIDNNSTDDSQEFLRGVDSKISVKLQEENSGFARACNLGFKNASGDYVLFLNPDTIVSEKSLQQCISFLESKYDAGAAGVRMIDGKGKFLKESKRSFPSPTAAFFKLFGFAKLFPRSKSFAKYYAGHLSEKEINTVDVLSGAFMMVKKNVLEKIGGFDETFFMYGEDIDLSFRIVEAGYGNYYLGNITITHLKGGSTRYNYKYVKTFYDAMNRFVKKHYEGKRSAAFILLLYSGIWLRKMIALAGLAFR